MQNIISAILCFFAAAVFAVSDGTVSASDANGKFTNYWTGTQSCAKVLEDFREGGVAASAAGIFVAGFVTAAGRYNDTQKPFGDVADIYGIEHLIRDYCDENPLDNLTDAAAYVVEAHLLPKAGYR